MKYLSRYFPFLAILGGALYIGWALLPPQDAEGRMHLNELAHVPVVKDGRVKPLDTLARNSLLIISGRQTVLDEEGKKQPPVKWLIDVMTSGLGYEQRPEFLISDPGVLRILGLKKRADSRYSLDDIRKGAPEFVQATLNARSADEQLQGVGAFIQLALGLHGLDREQMIKKLQDNPELQKMGNDLLVLADQIRIFKNVRRFVTPYKVFRIENDEVLSLLKLEPRPGLRYSFEEILPELDHLSRQAEQLRDIPEKSLDVFSKKLLEVYQHLQLYVGLARCEVYTLRVIPPLPGEDPENWRTIDQAREKEEALRARLAARSPSAKGTGGAEKRGPLYPALHDFQALLTAYKAGDVKSFNRQLDAYRELLDEQMPGQLSKVDFETRFNQFDPFYQCALLYVVVFLLACCAWLGWTEPLSRAAFGLAVLTLVVHSGALFSRMYLMDRPLVFVTNLYSSAVFIGWACIVAGLILEAVFRNGLGNAVAGLLGFLTLLLAPHLVSPGEIDTMGNLRAVLDTNFWLATHVTCVSMGYMATFFAGFLGAAFILRGLFTQSLDRQAVKTMGQMLYGVLCFALLFSFVGTVLGGIWADQSWGRFWGWDPKENGALLIVLMNALILHARWGGLIRQRGMAVLAVAGNMVTAWSWFGTNQLGVGLHAYGFNNALAAILVIFWGLMAVIIVLGLLPQSVWTSFAVQRPLNPEVPPPDQSRLRRR